MISVPDNNSRQNEAIPPDEIRRFLEAGIVVDGSVLPVRYADPDCFDEFQVGFRVHGVSGQSLVSDSDGGWRSGWYVLALNELDDPFFVDLADRGNGYPVYFAEHGAGAWASEIVAPSLAVFAERLAALQAAAHNRALFADALRGLSSAEPFWKEAHVAHLEASGEALGAPHQAYDQADYEEGALIVTSVGPHKLKVAQVASKQLKISLKDALALASKPEFSIATGAPIQLRRLEDQLRALGSTLVFRPFQ